MDDPSIDELPVVLQQPGGLSRPLLELIARRIRTEAESTIETFNLRPRTRIDLRRPERVLTPSTCGSRLRTSRQPGMVDVLWLS